MVKKQKNNVYMYYQYNIIFVNPVAQWSPFLFRFLLGGLRKPK
jgi:hypothetical protein